MVQLVKSVQQQSIIDLTGEEAYCSSLCIVCKRRATRPELVMCDSCIQDSDEDEDTKRSITDKECEVLVTKQTHLSEEDSKILVSSKSGNWMGGESPRSPIDLTGAPMKGPRRYAQINFRYNANEWTRRKPGNRDIRPVWIIPRRPPPLAPGVVYDKKPFKPIILPVQVKRQQPRPDSDMF